MEAMLTHQSLAYRTISPKIYLLGSNVMRTRILRNFLQRTWLRSTEKEKISLVARQLSFPKKHLDTFQMGK